MNCRACSKELGELELSLHQDIHFDCRKCSICHEAINMERIEKCLGDGIPLSHTTCYDEKITEKITVVITQELLDWHNERRLMFDPNPDLTVNANMMMAATNFRNSRWIHEMDHDNLFLTMKRLEAVAAEASMILSESKKRDEIKKNREKRDKDLIKSASEGRVTEQREKEIKRNRYTPDEKAIKTMIEACGMTREQAVEEITKQKVKRLMKEHADWDEARARLELEGPTVN